MAAEHEAPSAPPRRSPSCSTTSQVLMLARGSLDDVYARRLRPPYRRDEPAHAAHRRPQQGLAVRAGRARCCARPATGSAATPASSCWSDPDNDTEFFFLRPRDIAVYVGSGRLDVGITGRDLLLDSRRAAERDPAARLRRARRSASPRRPGAARDSARTSTGLRVATAYPGLVARLPARARRQRRGRSGSTAPSRPPSARRRRRDRRRRLDRHDAAAGRAGDLRRADPASPRRCWSAARGADPTTRGRASSSAGCRA